MTRRTGPDATSPSSSPLRRVAKPCRGAAAKVRTCGMPGPVRGDRPGDGDFLPRRRHQEDSRPRPEPGPRPVRRRSVIARSAAALVLLLLLGACARSTSDKGDGTPYPYAPDQLVLRVAYTGGFVTPQVLASRLPLVSVYGDGRVLTEGPTPAIYPGPALPNVQVSHIEQSAVQDLVDAALDAGVGDPDDLGSPPVADAPSTRITVSTGLETLETEVYALQEAPEDGGGLSADQLAARSKLVDFLARLNGVSTGESEPYSPTAVAALASTYLP